MSIVDKPIEKAYFSIGEVAELLDVNTSLLRFWETKFSEIAPRKTRGGNRLYSQAEVNLLKSIYYLVKVKGFTLKGAQEKLSADRQQVEAHHRTTEALTRLRAFLLELKEQL